MTARPVSSLDLADEAFLADPYPTFQRVRSEHPIWWHEGSQMWLVFSHEQCNSVLRDRRFGRIWSDREPAERFEPFNLLHRSQMMENEPPQHTRLRRKVSTAFARGHIERMRPRVRELGVDLLERVDGAEFDALADFAEPLPVLVIAELLGTPSADVWSLRNWSQAIVKMYERPTPAAEIEQAALDASSAFADYLRELIEERRGDLRDDLLSDLLRSQGQADETPLTDDEVLASAILLLNAGHEASVNVFGNGLVALLESPDQWQRLVSGQVPIQLAVEEMLRFDSALQLFERTATTDVEVAGQIVARGERIGVLLGSANRDEAVFGAPDQLDVGREPNPHLAFGAGLHFCLGAPLARMELAESLQLLTSAYPELSLNREPRRRPTFVLRGYVDVPVTTKERVKPDG